MKTVNENGEIDPKEWDEEPKELNNLLKDDKFQVIFNPKTKMLEVLLNTNKEVQAELKDYIEELNAINQYLIKGNN